MFSWFFHISRSSDNAINGILNKGLNRMIKSIQSTQRSKIWYAHVDSPGKDKLEFYLNIPGGDKIPRIGERVFSTNDNGRSGEYRVITSIIGLTKIYCEILGRFSPFVSIDYISIKDNK